MRFTSGLFLNLYRRRYFFKFALVELKIVEFSSINLNGELHLSFHYLQSFDKIPLDLLQVTLLIETLKKKIKFIVLR